MGRQLTEIDRIQAQVLTVSVGCYRHTARFETLWSKP